MRFTGTLQQWNDDRGFGFIAPQAGGEPVFVHVSAFRRDGRRPALGETLSFEIEPSSDGRKRAVRVRRAEGGARSPAGAQVRPGADRKRARPGGLAVSLAVAAALAGSLAYFIGWPSAPRPGTAHAIAEESRPQSASFRCDGRTHCSQMTSCAEAKYFLQHCPGTKMDGDNDGIPCETQWCTGPFLR